MVPHIVVLLYSLINAYGIVTIIVIHTKCIQVTLMHIKEWESRFDSCFESRHVQGTHFDMMKKSHAESVAQEIDAAFHELNSGEK